MAKHIFREWRKGEKTPSRYNKADYVIFHDDTQVGAAAMGWFGDNNIFFIEIFEGHRCRGHGTIFVREIEKEVKKSGFGFITAYPVSDKQPWIKWGYRVVKEELDGNMVLRKDL